MPLKHLKCQGCNRITVGFMTTYAYHHKCCEFESRSDKVYSIQHDVINCQWFAAGRWFSPGTQVSSTNKTDCHDTTEILLKVALNTMTLNPKVLGHLQTYQSSPLEPLDQFKPGWNVELMSLNYIQNLDKENDILKLKFSNLRHFDYYVVCLISSNCPVVLLVN